LQIGLVYRGAARKERFRFAARSEHKKKFEINLLASSSTITSFAMKSAGERARETARNLRQPKSPNRVAEDKCDPQRKRFDAVFKGC